METRTLADGCTECSCDGETWSCHDACDAPECEPGDTKLGEGECFRCACDATGHWDCPDIECQGCTPGEMISNGCYECVCDAQGTTWSCSGFFDGPSCSCTPGESYPAGDGCNTCTCGMDGVFRCTQIHCEDTCPPPTMRAGSNCSTGPVFARSPDGAARCCEYSTECAAPLDWVVYDNHESCANGGIRCESGEADCDGDPENGCETDITNSVTNCGGCGIACMSASGEMAACTNGQCQRLGGATSCTYRGIEHPIGASFPSRDGCNTCTCLQVGDGVEIACTERACMCSPTREASFRGYVSTDPDDCLVIDYGCPNHTTDFTNECGCGCEQGVECPDSYDCPADGSMEMMCVVLRERCPWTELIFR